MFGSLEPTKDISSLEPKTQLLEISPQNTTPGRLQGAEPRRLIDAQA